MESLWLLSLAIMVSIDSLVVSIVYSMQTNFSIRKALFLLISFTLMQILMPTFGYLIGYEFHQIILNFDHWIAFALLTLVGFNMIREGLKSETITKRETKYSYLRILTQAFATSIDALVIGVTLSLVNSSLSKSLIFIGVATLVLVSLGFLMGKKIRRLNQKKLMIFGGVIIVVLGIKILLQHTYFS